MPVVRLPREWLRRALRVALSYYVCNGLSCALGLLLISALVHAWLGPLAASAAGVGVIVCTPPDLPAPRRGKFWQLLPAFVLGVPLFFAVQSLHAHPILLGLLMVPATFLSFLGAAWGKRGLPLAVSAMFAMVFSMAVPMEAGWDATLHRTGYFALGAGLYLIYAVLANAVLNMAYRTRILADTLLAISALMEAQAERFAPAEASAGRQRLPLIGQLMRAHAALADHLQAARDLLLEKPRTSTRQRLAGMLLQILEMRDHLLASELDLEELRALPALQPVLAALRTLLQALAQDTARMADALLLGRRPVPFVSRQEALERLSARLEALTAEAAPLPPALAGLAAGLIRRVGHVHDETGRLHALARGEREPDLALVQATWRLFVSPVRWSWRPLRTLWRRDAPPLRHALRAALAIGLAYALSLLLPWGTHDYWILLTIVVVLRGSLAQTLERRNSRVAGTVLGCLIASALLHFHPGPLLLLAIVTLSQGIAHAFTARRYLVTAVAATLLALLQAQLLGGHVRAGFEVLERLADTLLGASIAWGFSYVLPSWERDQIPQRLARTLAAQARHARMALALGSQPGRQAAGNPELEWRLARKEAYDSLSEMVQATQRSLSEPRAVRPPLAALGQLLSHSYQLLAQLTAVKTMLLLRSERLDPGRIRGPLAEAAKRLEAILGVGALPSPPDAATAGCAGRLELPAFGEEGSGDLSARLLRRLDLAEALAWRVRRDAERVHGAESERDRTPDSIPC